MGHFYVVCELGVENCRVLLGSLQNDELIISEVSHFPNIPIQEKESLQWNIPQLYEQVVTALHGVGSYEEAVAGISCTSWGGDYLLIDSDGAIVSPTYHFRDPRTQAGIRKVLSKTNSEFMFCETGMQEMPACTLFQLAAETPKRLRRAHLLLPIADAFNYLLSGVPRIEMSSAGATHLLHLGAKTWSDRLLYALHVSPKLFPPLTGAGTELGPLQPYLADKLQLDEARVIASCSNDLAATLVGLPVGAGSWAFLDPGTWTLMGTQVERPIINDASREMKFSNQVTYGNTFSFQKQEVGLWVLQECQRHWGETDRGLDSELLSHLAGSSPAFESLIDLTDPRFLSVGDMPMKIQAYCRETNQPVPRKPGQVYRCILESLALLYRRMLGEIESLTGRKITRVYMLGGAPNSLLNHFTANALELPVEIVSRDAAAMGNAVVQALALGHIETLDEARDLVRRSFDTRAIIPHTSTWTAVYDRAEAIFAA
jgi:rhamnulokinase